MNREAIGASGEPVGALASEDFVDAVQARYDELASAATPRAASLGTHEMLRASSQEQA